MTSLILHALVLVITLTDMHQHEMCPKISGQMKCETTIQFIDVNHGENLSLNCTCLNNSNGQWIGPNRSPTLYTTADKFIPYTQGTKLNPVLNKSKYAVLGGYDKKECQLQIMNFVSDDEGLYKCHYIDALTVYVHAYNVVAIRFPAYTNCPKRLTDPEFVSSSSYGYCWLIMGSLVGVLVICFVTSHICCCLNRATKSSLVISPEVQYDEIETINYNDVVLRPTSYVNQQTTSRVSDSNNSLFRTNVESSEESSFIRQSNLTLNNDDYEHPYHTINPANFEIHQYSNILLNNYQNTIIFPVSTGTKTANNYKAKDNNIWLVIYIKEK